MTAPVRLRLSRRAGFNLQALSLATNGLPAVNCARPSEWGNPFRVAPDFDQAAAVRCFRNFVAKPGAAAYRARIRIALQGKNLACWCAPGTPCHCDVLVEIANE